MRICVIGKISPIQGGTSKLNFWICQALAEAGHEVHLVSNANEVEAQYRTIGGEIPVDLSDTPLAHLKSKLHIYCTDSKSHYSYIPYANPYVSKLTSIALEVIKNNNCELIFGHYIEPYGIAAYFASMITGVPFGLMHAGSDVGRLFQNPELRTLYSSMMKNASFIFASNSTKRRFIEEGVNASQLYPLPRSTYAEAIYTPESKELDLRRHVQKAREELGGTWYESLLDQYPISNYIRARPTIAIYGKTGGVKGSYDLVSALSKLMNEGVDFNFLALTSSGPKTLSTFLAKVNDAGLSTKTTWLPFVAHWKIPEFLALADIACFLERDFSIPIHHPAVPVEILLCGKSLILSKEIADKQRYKNSLIDGENVLIVEPRDIDSLANKLRRVLLDKSFAQDMGKAGREMILQYMGSGEKLATELGETFHGIYQDILLMKAERNMIEFQSFLNRLYTDDVFRKLNELNPDIAHSFYVLSDEEKALLKKVEARAVEEFADGLKVKSRQRHLKIFPLTVAALENKAVDYFDRFYALNRPYPGETKQALSNKFGQFLEDAVLADKEMAPEIAELVRFERKFVELSLRTSHEDDFRYINAPAPVSTFDLATLIRLKPSVHIERYDFDIPSFAEQLKKDPAKAKARSMPTNVVFSVRPNEASPKVLKMNDASVRLLELAAQPKTITELAQLFSKVQDKPASEKDVIEAVQFFVKGGLLESETNIQQAA